MMRTAFFLSLFAIAISSRASDSAKACLVAMGAPVPVLGLEIKDDEVPLNSGPALISARRLTRALLVTQNRFSEISIIENPQTGSGPHVQELTLLEMPSRTAIVGVRYSEADSTVVLYIQRAPWAWLPWRDNVHISAVINDARVDVGPPIPQIAEDFYFGELLLPDPLNNTLPVRRIEETLRHELHFNSDSVSRTSIKLLGYRTEGGVTTAYFLNTEDQTGLETASVDTLSKILDRQINYVTMAKVNAEAPREVLYVTASFRGRFEPDFVLTSPKSEREIYLLRTISGTAFKGLNKGPSGDLELVKLNLGAAGWSTVPLAE